VRWRDSIAPMVAEVIARVGKYNDKELRKALREAYPYGQRTMWPYKVWCSEVRRQLGRSLRKGKVDERQEALF